MTFERKVSEPKLSKDGLFMVRKVKLGNKLLGTIESLKVRPGEARQVTFWASKELVKPSKGGGFLTVTQVHTNGLASYGVTALGLRESDGTTYTTEYRATQQRGVAYVDVAAICWEVHLPPEEERVESLMKAMRIAGRGRKSSVT